MFFGLIPKEEQFFDLLQNAATNAVKATHEFRLLVEQWNQSSPHFKGVRDIESEGDLITHEVIDKLNRTFITPIDREDIHRLAGEIDDVCDILQALSDRMELYELESTTETLRRMAVLLEESGSHMEAAIKQIRNFRKTSRASDHCIEIKRVENEADELLKHALAEMFRVHKADPLYVIKWKEIYETIEFAHDKMAHIANTVEGILVKNA
jgi:predicted phosphate transport protein (TIGR00153 family)